MRRIQKFPVSARNSLLIVPNQSGFAPIFVVLLLVVGILGGTYLVQQRTNINPFAASDSLVQIEKDLIMSCDSPAIPSLIRNSGTKNSCTIHLRLVSKTPTSSTSCHMIYQEEYDPSCAPTDVAIPEAPTVTATNPQNTVQNEPSITFCNKNNQIVNQDNQILETCSGGKVCKPISNTEARCSPPQNLTDCVNSVSYGDKYTRDPTTGLCTLIGSTPTSGITPGTATTTKSEAQIRREACVAVETSGGNVSRRCNLNGTTYCDDAKTLVTRSGGFCATQDQLPDAQGCAYNYQKKTCAANEHCTDKGDGKATCTNDPSKAAAPNRVANAQGNTDPNAATGGGAAVAEVPTDAKNCAERTACVFSEGNVCKVGLCDENAKNCGFNSECRFQNAIQMNCISGSEYKIGDKTYRPGTTIDCALKDAAGSTARAVAAGTVTQTTTTAAAAPTQTTREQLAQKCGFVNTTFNNIPFNAIGLGENVQIQDVDCQRLAAEQKKYFDSYLARAREEAAEVARRNNLVYENNEFRIDPAYTQNANPTEIQAATQKANELNQSLAQPIKQAEEKAGKCANLKDQELANCLKEAQGTVQTAATAAQKQAVQNALAKLKQIMAKQRPGGCVKADLGITPFLEAQRLKRKDGDDDEARRVLLCQGDTKNDLKWRVLVGGLATGESTVIENNDGTTRTVTNTSGSNDGDACGDRDCGNDAERIYGLYGTDPNATNVTPKFPYTVPGKNSFTFYDPNSADGIEKTIGAYIKAAEEGKTTLRSAPVPGDNGSPGSGNPTPPTSGNNPPPTDPNAECNSINDCLIKHGDGWTCNASLKCTDTKSNNCTTDAYCVQKFGKGYSCSANECAITSNACDSDTECRSGNICSTFSPRRCVEPNN